MKLRHALVVITLAFGAASTALAQEQTLYKRLGGYDALAAVADDFLGRLGPDPKLGRFFVGHSTDSIMRIRGHVIDLLCVATKGPCSYTGRDMKTSHAGLRISDEEWDIAVKALVATLAKFRVPQAESGEVLALVSSLKSDIVAR